MTEELDRSGESPNSGDLYSHVTMMAAPQGANHAKTQTQMRPASGRLVRTLLVGLLSVALVGAPTIGFAGEKAAETGRESGLGAAAAISSLIYGPVKLLYATGGLVVGAFAWVFTAGDTQVADRVFTRSLRGTYVITPDILTGDKELIFIGRDVDESAVGTGVLASASRATEANSSTIDSATAGATATGETFDESGYDEMGW